MASVEIYLVTRDVSISFLSIPIKDVKRLSVRPFKWLRFVMYCICGAPGEISAMAQGDPVEYDSTELADANVRYYYQASQENLVFVDLKGLNDRVTSSTTTRRSGEFREQILQRDGSCVITGEEARVCDAAHLIPKVKGDEYIKRVMRDRSHLDGSELATEDSPIVDIDDIRNGVLLRKDLHVSLGTGWFAFLKTPNVGLGSADIPWVGEGPAPDTRVTPHRFVEPAEYDHDRAQRLCNTPQQQMETVADRTYLYASGAPVDANFQDTDTTPPVVLLNFIYGVAAYQHWQSPPGISIIEKYFKDHYKTIPVPPPRAPSSESSFDEQDDLEKDPTYSQKGRHHTEGRHHTSAMEKAMDDVDLVFMFLRGITPQEAAIRREKRLEEEEQMAQEAGQRKVREWIDTNPT